MVAQFVTAVRSDISPAREGALACVWLLDPATGRLVCAWNAERVSLRRPLRPAA